MVAASVEYRREGENYQEKNANIQQRDQNGLQSNGSCETAIVNSLHLTPAPHCSNGHAAS